MPLVYAASSLSPIYPDKSPPSRPFGELLSAANCDQWSTLPPGSTTRRSSKVPSGIIMGLAKTADDTTRLADSRFVMRSADLADLPRRLNPKALVKQWARVEFLSRHCQELDQRHCSGKQELRQKPELLSTATSSSSCCILPQSGRPSTSYRSTSAWVILCKVDGGSPSSPPSSRRPRQLCYVAQEVFAARKSNTTLGRDPPTKAVREHKALFRTLWGWRPSTPRRSTTTSSMCYRPSTPWRASTEKPAGRPPWNLAGAQAAEAAKDAVDKYCIEGEQLPSVCRHYL